MLQRTEHKKSMKYVIVSNVKAAYYRIMNNRSRRLYFSQYKAIHGVKNEFKVCKLFSLIIIFIFTTSDIYSPSGENCQQRHLLETLALLINTGNERSQVG